jgi:hypothetical protein
MAGAASGTRKCRDFRAEIGEAFTTGFLWDTESCAALQANASVKTIPELALKFS